MSGPRLQFQLPAAEQGVVVAVEAVLVLEAEPDPEEAAGLDGDGRQRLGVGPSGVGDVLGGAGPDLEDGALPASERSRRATR